MSVEIDLEIQRIRRTCHNVLNCLILGINSLTSHAGRTERKERLLHYVLVGASVITKLASVVLLLSLEIKPTPESIVVTASILILCDLFFVLVDDGVVTNRAEASPEDCRVQAEEFRRYENELRRLKDSKDLNDLLRLAVIIEHAADCLRHAQIRFPSNLSEAVGSLLEDVG